MNVSRIPSPVDIAVSGLRAEAVRMKVVAANIANASTTRTANGQPYRRQEVVLATRTGYFGVATPQVLPDMVSPFKRVCQPGHPDADKDGFVMMPNVDLPVEMMSMITASRAYQANATVLRRYQENGDATLELLR
jgi:flagellar basal-body rod protein FlgC